MPINESWKRGYCQGQRDLCEVVHTREPLRSAVAASAASARRFHIVEQVPFPANQRRAPGTRCSGTGVCIGRLTRTQGHAGYIATAAVYGIESGGPHQCTSRKVAQSITTNMVAMAIAIQTLNRALRMGAPFGSGRQVPVPPESYPTAVKIFCNRRLAASR
jgi:hypothetical protein